MVRSPMASARSYPSIARRLTLLGLAILVLAACGGGTDAKSQARGQASTTNPASAPCPDKAVTVTGPDDWHMTNNFSGQQTWEGTARVTNPNSSDVQVIGARSFALVTVTKADGTTYSGYTGPLMSVLPSGGADAQVLAGKTIEMATSGMFIRPAKVTTAQMFLDVGASGRNGCTVRLEGAQPSTAAARGPHICANGLDTDRGGPNIDIGLRQTQDQPACP